jgi:hypothetical protein
MKTCETCKHWADVGNGAISHMENGHLVRGEFSICLATNLVGAFQQGGKLLVATKDPQIEWQKIERGADDADYKKEFGLITDENFGCVNHKEAQE